MGIVINKDLLKKIYTDYEKNKGQNKNTNEKAKVKKTKNLDIFKNNLINTKKIDYGNQNEIILENNKENRAKINKIDDEVNKNINNILFRRHKSFDYQLNNKMQNELILSNYPNYNDNNSVEDNKSINSDYSDISSESLLIKRTNIKNENKLKSIKLRNSYYTKLVLSEILTFQKIPKVTNIFIFDWDDTLMCTSFVAPCGVLNIEDMKQNDKLNMKNLDQLVSALLIK